MSRVGVDQAVRILEGKPYMKTMFTLAKVLTKDNFRFGACSYSPRA